MFNVLSDINWLSVVIAYVVSFALAGLWFAVLIVKPYAVALGRVGQPAPPTTPVSAAGPLVCQLVTLLATAVLVEALDITSTSDAIAFGLVVGIGFLASMTYQIAINPNFPRPLLYGAINAPYFVVSSVISATILVAMR